MNQQEALSILIEGVKKAYAKQVYSLEEAGAVYLAMQAFAPKTAGQPETPSQPPTNQKSQEPPSPRVPGQE